MGKAPNKALQLAAQSKDLTDHIHDMKDKEYELKWQYVMHTENMQAKFIQWYLTVCSVVFVFIYSEKVTSTVPIVRDRWFALLTLALYSILTCLRLLAQKRNYDVYTERLRELENSGSSNDNTRTKIISVFKLQYYIVCVVGGLVYFSLSSELSLGIVQSITVGALYTSIAVFLSFTRLIGK